MDRDDIAPEVIEFCQKLIEAGGDVEDFFHDAMDHSHTGRCSLEKVLQIVEQEYTGGGSAKVIDSCIDWAEAAHHGTGTTWGVYWGAL